MDKAYWDYARWDNFRWDVYRPDWDNIILPNLKQVDASKIWDDILASLQKEIE